ncbi:glycosyltransferase family A protein [Flavobacterium sp. LHD-80]|uniref:glycosyltransferase family 2 protein n=1 Tax=Flavobacterium sp. LHD-80 TaxID=3071411 RepID=UPI0027E18FEE|nr:glycosyltransferase family A protein [Flavobacterium sp. LHD-80]MDQ6472050.1 glycosyltransferase family A protein [Flavobacterium sp. LHD-80]
MNPLLSIVIPTKNRYFYLENFVKSFVAFESSEIELVIQDNSDIQSVEFLDYLESVNDKRIKYNYSKDSLSMVENCDRSIELALGEYVCMLGDDDGVLFEISMDVVKFCINNKYEAAIVNKAEYYWPETSHAVWKDLLAGKVFYKDYKFHTKKISVNDELSNVLREGSAWSLGLLPRVYHGFVKKEKLDELRQISGSYFPGPSPDMANAIGLAKVVKHLIEIDVPAVISGHSKKSGGGMGGEKKHHGKIEDQPFLPKDTIRQWSSNIPRFWSGATIYATSAREALNRTDNSKDYKLNYTYLWAFCLVFEPSYMKEVFSVISKNPLQIPLLSVYVFNLTTFRAFNYISNYFKFNNKSNLSISAKDIFESQNALNNLLHNKVIFVSGTKIK